MLRALYRAAVWCADAANRDELASLLASPAYLARPDESGCRRRFQARIRIGGGEVRPVADFFIPLAKAATFPWKSHALWFYSQMVRWRQIGTHAGECCDSHATPIGPISIAPR